MRFCELFALFYVLIRILWLSVWENEKGLWYIMGIFAIRIKAPIVLVRRVNKKKGHPREDVLSMESAVARLLIKKVDCY